jgi:hypothetical protein
VSRHFEEVCSAAAAAETRFSCALFCCVRKLKNDSRSFSSSISAAAQKKKN